MYPEWVVVCNNFNERHVNYMILIIMVLVVAYMGRIYVFEYLYSTYTIYSVWFWFVI